MRLLSSLIALALASAPLAAQPRPPVAGTVRDSTSRQPLPGAVVLLLDSAGGTVARGTTDQRGQYRVPTPVAAQRMRVLRLGFRPQERALATETEFALVAIPSLLEQVRVTEAASCPRRPDRAAAFALLEQVRAGLLATVVARSQNRARMTRLLYERRFDGPTDRIVSQTVRTSVATGADRPFGAARSAAAFVRQGFLEDSSNTFFAPDAETLIEDAFSAGYCFHLARPDPARPHQLGLGFAAARARDDGRVDIDGTLWVDTLARALRDLEFRYVGLDKQVSALAPGGRLSFREVANGITLVDRWALRLVSGRRVVGLTGATLPSAETLLGGRTSRFYATEIGGELAEAAWPDGYTWTAPLGTLKLHAVTPTGMPAEGRTVRLDGTDYQGTTDSFGVLELKRLLPGPYSASVVEPRLAVLGVSMATPLRFVAARDSTVEARVEVGTAEDFVARRCLADQARNHTIDTTGTAWLLAQVLSDGKPVNGARWSIQHRDAAVLVERGRTDADGLLHWCQLRRGTTVIIEVSDGARRGTATQYLKAHLSIVRVILPPP
jgi:hypothetical protein